MRGAVHGTGGTRRHDHVIASQFLEDEFDSEPETLV